MFNEIVKQHVVKRMIVVNPVAPVQNDFTLAVLNRTNQYGYTVPVIWKIL
jgi:hypothetical protein